MVSSRTVTALAGLVASFVLSVVLWQVFGSPVFFLFVPFVPFLFRSGGDSDERRPPRRECPACGFQTRDPGFDYCPRDGTRLEVTSDRSEHR